MKNKILLAGMAALAVSLACAGCSAANTPQKVTEVFVKAIKNNNMAEAKKYATPELKEWLGEDFNKLIITRKWVESWTQDVSIIESLSTGYKIPEKTYTDSETRMNMEVITNWNHPGYGTTGWGNFNIRLIKAAGGKWLVDSISTHNTDMEWR